MRKSSRDMPVSHFGARPRPVHVSPVIGFRYLGESGPRRLSGERKRVQFGKICSGRISYLKAASRIFERTADISRCLAASASLLSSSS